MRLYEFEGKRLFKQFNIPIPDGQLASGPDQVSEIVQKIGPAVLKSQVLTGGRGKAGGIKVAEHADTARKLAGDLFKLMIKGFPVEPLWSSPNSISPTSTTLV